MCVSNQTNYHGTVTIIPSRIFCVNVNIPHLVIVESGNIWTSQVHPSVLSICPCAFLYDGWLEFFHTCTWYHDQVAWAADACNTEFGYMANLSKYDNVFINCVCLLLYTCNICVDFVHTCIWYSNQVPCICSCM